MGEVTVNSTGLQTKISSLFNNALFSDVEFVFPGCNKKIYGHKLILALRSKKFACMFFDKNKDSTSSIELPAAKQASFELLFRFLYTDNVQLHTFKEAQELCLLANEYGIEELCEKCGKYMLKDKLTIENLFSRYEYALKNNVGVLLKDCRDFACSHTQLILKSKNFTSSSPEVIEDIIKQDNLLIISELDVITAVLNWGEEDLKRKKIPYDEKHLRNRINQFMKHLRFLTLSPSEFDSFVENHDVLSSKESSLLTRKILQPECNVNLPKDICCIADKRRIVHLSSNSANLNKPSLDSKNTKLDIQPIVFDDSFVYDDSYVYVTAIYPMPAISDSSKSISDLTKSLTNVANSKQNVSKPQKLDFSKSQITDFSKSQISNFSKSQILDFSQSPVVNPSKSIVSKDCEALLPSGISYEVKKPTFKENKVMSPQVKQTKFRSSPNISSWSLSQREYTFSLQENSSSGLQLSFRRDIKCSVIFKMKSGNIFLRAFDLKIKNKYDENDELDIFVHMTGFSERPFSKFYKEKVHNNILTVKFSQPMILHEGNKGELEVSIENLHLNRCSVCYGDQTCEFNCGLGFGVEFQLKSNQKSSDGFLFLIDKLYF